MTMYKYKTEVYQEIDNNFWSGMIKKPIQEINNVYMHWKGPKMSMAMLEEIKSFFLWTYDTYGSESVVRLAFNETTGTWKTYVCPQEMQKGLAVHDELDEATMKAIQRDGYSFLGTIHHHCGSSAFASGTDNADEIKSPGFHATMGGLDSEKWSLDCRLTQRNEKYDTKWSEWIECPTGYILPETAPSEIVNSIIEAHLKMKPAQNAFPEEWKAKCIKKKVVVTTQYSNQPNLGYLNTQTQTEKKNSSTREEQNKTGEITMEDGIVEDGIIEKGIEWGVTILAQTLKLSEETVSYLIEEEDLWEEYKELNRTKVASPLIMHVLTKAEINKTKNQSKKTMLKAEDIIMSIREVLICI